MEGLVIKDHTTSTVGRCFVMNRVLKGSPYFFSALALNPPVGGLNPSAVEAALRAGADMVFFPTYGAKNHIDRWGKGKPPTPFPFPEDGFEGITVLGKNNAVADGCDIILKMIAAFDAVLATGHLSPDESLEILKMARRYGIKRMLVTHASESVVAMSLMQQEEAVKTGAFIEHSFFAVTESCPNPASLETIYEQVRAIGVDHVILSSDFGQISNPPPVEGFAYYLEKIRKLGFSYEELRVMIHDNPKTLLERDMRNKGQIKIAHGDTRDRGNGR
jgi:predicted TIM-barrel fold metal-dependent hydrolase